MNGGGEEGYTLVEALVAFAILAAAMVISFESFGSGLRHLATVDDRKSAIEMARQEIDRLATKPFLSAGTVAGETNGRQWEMEVTAIGEEESGSLQHPFMIKFRLTKPDGESEPMLETILLSSTSQQ